MAARHLASPRLLLPSAPFWRSVSFAARNAGAPRRNCALLCTLALGAAGAASPLLLQAATPQLLQVRPAELRGTVSAQSVTPATRGAPTLRLQVQWEGGREDLQLEPNSALGVLADRLQHLDLRIPSKSRDFR